MINATANEILSSLIGSKKSQLEEDRNKLSMYQYSMYQYLIDSLEADIRALENASEIIIGDSDGKKSIIYKRDPDEPTINYYSSKGHRYHGMSITECKGEKQ